MLLTIRLELGSTGSLEMSRFQGLSSGKQRLPPRKALAPKVDDVETVASPLDAPELALGVMARAARREAATRYEAADFIDTSPLGYAISPGGSRVDTARVLLRPRRGRSAGGSGRSVRGCYCAVQRVWRRPVRPPGPAA